MSRHQQHRQLRLTGAQQRQQLMPIHARHIDVADHQAERLFSHSLQRLFGRADGTISKTTQLQGIAQGLTQCPIILDQQHLDCLHCSFSIFSASINGNVTSAQVPRPGRERICKVP
ncbi:hypothetical protein D3C76_1469250 [compost metagenome]